MSLPHKADPRDDPAPEYYYRRPLAGRDLLPAFGAGVGVGLVAFYIARLYLQRTPLIPTAPARRRFGSAADVLAVEGDVRD